MDVKTKFADGVNPFTGMKDGEFDPRLMVINKQKPMPKRRPAGRGKYDDMFDKLNIGDSVTVPAEAADKVWQALSGYLKRYNKRGKVKRMPNDPKPGFSTIYRIEK